MPDPIKTQDAADVTNIPGRFNLHVGNVTIELQDDDGAVSRWELRQFTAGDIAFLRARAQKKSQSREEQQLEGLRLALVSVDNVGFDDGRTLTLEFEPVTVWRQRKLWVKACQWDMIVRTLPGWVLDELHEALYAQNNLTPAEKKNYGSLSGWLNERSTATAAPSSQPAGHVESEPNAATDAGGNPPTSQES